MEVLYVLILTLLFFAVVFLGVSIGKQKKAKDLAEQRREAVQRKHDQAMEEQRRLICEAIERGRDSALKEFKEFEKQQEERNQELLNTEKRLQKRTESLDKKQKKLEEFEGEMKGKEGQLKNLEQQAQDAFQTAEMVLQEARSKLESVANLTKDEARQELMGHLEEEARKIVATQVKEMEESVLAQSEEKARSVIATAIQRVTNEFVSDACVSVITLPSDDMKGRIIGREGRNIRAIEQATGIDLIIDDTPEAVLISSFNPMRREIAKTAIERLVADGRIHPARIEEVVTKVRSEVQDLIRETGERTCFECGIQGLHNDIVMAIGKLRYKTTGQQSVLNHSVEVCHIAGHIASELGVNVPLTKRAALLHDIGKALDDEYEGHHAVIGAQFAKRCNEPALVVETIEKHHIDNIQGCSIITAIVQAANQLSSFRPAARKDFLEKSVQRLVDMENLVTSYAGVEQAFVVRSGKEVRALVEPTVLDDDAVCLLTKDIAKRIRTEMHNNGPVKVTMIREVRVTEIAR